MIFQLALADVLYERKMFLCYAVALAAVLAPLMVLYGLKTGVIAALTGQLLEDPRNREILVIGNRSYTEGWLDALARRPEVGFLAPRTRSIAATLYVERTEDQSGGGPELAELIPSAPGDPLLDPALPPLAGDRVALSHALAERLGVRPGAVLRGSAIRQVGEARQRAVLPLTVAQVLPAEVLERKGMLAPLDLLQAVEDYRDGLAVPRYGWDGAERGTAPRPYASFRLYARTLDDVGPLADALTAQGLEVRSREAEIAMVRQLDRNLMQIFAIIAGLGGAGYLLSLGASLWSNVERKHRELAIIRLLGVPTAGLVRFPVVQAWLLSLGGIALAFALYALAERAINALFAAPVLAGRPVCLLLPEHYALAAAATIGAALLASAVAGWQASRVEPAEGMRDV